MLPSLKEFFIKKYLPLRMRQFTGAKCHEYVAGWLAARSLSSSKILELWR